MSAGLRTWGATNGEGGAAGAFDERFGNSDDADSEGRVMELNDWRSRNS